MYSLKNLITKETVQEQLSDDEIFEYYLAPVNFNQYYKNILRDDENAGCKYYINKGGNLRFIDYSLGKSWDCYSFVMEKYGVNFHEALWIIYTEMIEGVEIDKTISSVKKPIKYQYQKKILKATKKEYTSKELDFWSVGGIKSTKKDLEDFNIYSADCYWINDKLFDNVKNTYIYVGENRKIDQIYSPNKEKNNFRFINRNNFKFNLNPIQNETDTFFLAKSKKCSYFISRFGYQTGYTSNEQIVIDKEIFSWIRLNYKNIFVMGDNDDTGQSFMESHYNEYGMIPSPVPIKKDFTEYLNDVGYLEAGDFLKSLI